MHGLGSNAEDMQALAQQISISSPVKHVLANAPRRAVTINQGMMMPAWYDIFATRFTEVEDSDGILDSEHIIHQLTNEQIEAGFQSNQILLAGFSQGGAMALFAGLRYKHPLAGIVSLSAYLPLAKECVNYSHLNTPIFMASGQFDSVVMPKWTEQSKDWLIAQGLLNITYTTYLMEHSVCAQEIADLSCWLNNNLLIARSAGANE